MSKAANKKSLTTTILFGAGALALALGVAVAWFSESDQPKLVVIAIDGVSYREVMNASENGTAPALAALTPNGAVGAVDPPGNDRDPNRYWSAALGGVVADEDSQAKTTVAALPAALAGAGRRPLMVAFPGTFPAPQIEGWAVSDRIAPGNPGKDEAGRASYSHLAKMEGAVWPPYIAGRVAAALIPPGDVPRQVYEQVLPMNDQDWSDFKNSAGRTGKFGAAKTAMATDYNLTVLAEILADQYGPEALMIHLPGAAMLENMKMEAEPGFSQAVSRLVMEALYQEIRKNYLTFLDGLVARFIGAAGPETLFVVVTRPASPTEIDPSTGASIKSQGFLLVTRMGEKNAPPTKNFQAKPLDITPTLLYLLQLPQPKELKGSPVPEVTDKFRQ